MINKDLTGTNKSQMKVLHVAPEKQIRILLESKASIDYISVDKYRDDVTEKADITDLRFENDSFDLIICNHVLEHVIDDRKAMSELYRVLKPEGVALLLVPLKYDMETTYEDETIVTPEAREKHFGQHDHVRYYGLDYFDRLGEVGFYVSRINRDEIVDVAKQAYYGVDKIGPIIIGEKK